MTDDKRTLLRHALATIAYRGGKALRGAPQGFEDFRPTPAFRTAGGIVAHLGDLFEWSLTLANGAERWKNATPLPFEREVARFFATLSALDARLAADAPLACTPERLLQGPVADSLTHVGQITMLRRMAGSPVPSENFSVADIAVGRVGPDQAKPAREWV